jgi:hypothetical protein
VKRPRRPYLRSAALAALALMAGLGALPREAAAQSYSVLYDVGSLKASAQAGAWPNWTFATDVDIGTSTWVAVNIVNTDCFIGANDPRSGTANAGAIAWYAQLYPAPSPFGYVIYGGMLGHVEGTQATGQVAISIHPGVDSFTHVSVQVSNLEQFAQDNTFRVCVAGT